MSDALVADGLTKRYGQTVALDRCSFAIPAHTIVALVARTRQASQRCCTVRPGWSTRQRGRSPSLAGRPAIGRFPGSASSPRTPRCTETSPPTSCS